MSYEQGIRPAPGGESSAVAMFWPPASDMAWRVLRVLWVAGSGRSVAAVATMLCVEAPVVREQFRRLLAAGWVETVPQPPRQPETVVRLSVRGWRAALAEWGYPAGTERP